MLFASSVIIFCAWIYNLINSFQQARMKKEMRSDFKFVMWIKIQVQKIDRLFCKVDIVRMCFDSLTFCVSTSITLLQ